MPHHTVRYAVLGDAPDTLRLSDGAIGAGDDIEALAAVVAIPGFHALRHRAHALPGVVHSLHRGLHAGGVPKLERPHFPIEAGPHGAVHAGRIVGDLRQTIRDRKST